MGKSRRIHIIACGVLKVDLGDIIGELGLDITFQYLPAGLHSRPHELRRELQEAIDSVKTPLDRIAIGYGLCGLGTIDIHSREIPLAIPRVHDCISLFLGSDTAYREQFSQYPGTYYLSAGWVEGKSQPQSSPASGKPTGGGPSEEEFRKFVESYGEENAEAIRHFLTSWQRNYQRAVFIDTGATRGKEKIPQMARDMATEFGWIYEKIDGSPDLLLKLLKQTETSDDILIVPPHHVTVYQATERKLTAVPLWQVRRASTTRTLVLETAEKAEVKAGRDEGLGLGIDAGGTYTDAVLFDFRNNSVIQKSKALTTKWDFSVGIREALEQLGAELLPEVRLVSVSTTLATNAIVEGKGQPVGLLIMPPYGKHDPSRFKHDPLAVIDGQLEIDGRELAPINPRQVRRVVREMMDSSGVEAFAVTGYASHSNPSHELQVKSIIEEETGLPVTCGHDVSDKLNYRIRAETAALNARIIPCLESFFEEIQTTLEKMRIQAPIMVVKSDGSLTSIRAAREKPIETILSGPAASVAGVRHLTKTPNALVCDMGGTTSDTAIIREGEVKTCDEGAIVGGWETHVKALDMRTLGLGGDSLIAIDQMKLMVGPKRVCPVSLLSATQPNCAKAIDWLERYVSQRETSTKSMEIIALNEHYHQETFEGREGRIVESLKSGPCSLWELADRTDSPAWQLLPLNRLEEHHVIQRCSLTPTDALHVLGRVKLWNSESAERLCGIFGRLLEIDADTLARRVIELVEKRLAMELLKKEMVEHIDADDLDRSNAATALIERALEHGTEGFHLKISLDKPIIGIGAPAYVFLPGVAKRLNTESIIPTDADVANAIGAITSSVIIRRRVRIASDETGVFRLDGLPEAPRFSSLQEAQDHAVKELTEIVRNMAKKAGTNQTKIEISIDDNIGSTSDGAGVFLGRILEARLTGRPEVDVVLTSGASEPH